MWRRFCDGLISCLVLYLPRGDHVTSGPEAATVAPVESFGHVSVLPGAVDSALVFTEGSRYNEVL